MHPISYLQALVLGLLQGASELFPVSSLGHSVILPKLLGWDIHQNDDYFITFLVATHLATALLLLGFFWSDWARIVNGLLRSLREREIRPDDTDAKLGWLLAVGTIPAGLLGLLLEHSLRHVFASARSASFFLMLNGVMLFGAERLRRRAPTPAPEQGDGDRRIARTTSWRQALGIGTAQAIALIPGFSRSGATMGGGLLVGLSNEDAARFSFLLATPIIGAAAALKLPDLLGSKGDGVRGPAALGALGAAVTAYMAVRFLMRFFESGRLTRSRRTASWPGRPCPSTSPCRDREVPVSKNRQLVIPAVAVGVVLILIAIVYWVDSAGALPSFFPGHEAGSSHHHIKHGLAAFILGVGAFIFAWFQTGPSSAESAA